MPSAMTRLTSHEAPIPTARGSSAAWPKTIVAGSRIVGRLPVRRLDPRRKAAMPAARVRVVVVVIMVAPILGVFRNGC
jgi:hypothetical protein